MFIKEKIDILPIKIVLFTSMFLHCEIYLCRLTWKKAVFNFTSYVKFYLLSYNIVKIVYHLHIFCSLELLTYNSTLTNNIPFNIILRTIISDHWRHPCYSSKIQDTIIEISKNTKIGLFTECRYLKCHNDKISTFNNISDNNKYYTYLQYFETSKYNKLE